MNSRKINTTEPAAPALPRFHVVYRIAGDEYSRTVPAETVNVAALEVMRDLWEATGVNPDHMTLVSTVEVPVMRVVRGKRGDPEPETRAGYCCGCNTYQCLFKIPGIFRYRCDPCYVSETGHHHHLAPPTPRIILP